MRSRFLLLQATALTSVATFAAPAFAQDPAPAPSMREVPAPDDPQVGEVVVTAQKRAQNVRDVPISINVVSGADLQKNNISDVNSLQGSIPSLRVVGGPTSAGYTLRGFGSPPGNPAFNLDISIYQDGIYGGKQRQFLAPLFDLERVEVLRGPQGSLLGKNTSAGAISFTTANPTRDFEGSATLGYNISRKGVEGQGFVSGPLSDTLSARLAIKYTNISGYIDNVATNGKDPKRDEKLVRLGLRWEPVATFTNTLKVEYNDFDQTGNWQIAVPTGVRISDNLTTTKNDPGPNGVRTYANQHGWNISNTAEADVGFADLVGVSGYSYYRSDALGAGATRNPSRFGTRFQEHLSQWSQEVRLVSHEKAPFSWVVGTYADVATFRGHNIVTYQLAPIFQNGVTDIFIGTKSKTYSAYASINWHLTDALVLLANGRYTHNRISGNYINRQVSGTPLLTSFPHAISAVIKEDNFDPSATLQYYFSPRFNVYASYSQGSKSGGFDGFNRTVRPAAFTVQQTRTKNYEIGAKAAIANWLSLDIAGFILDAENLQVNTYIPLLGNVTGNAGAARSKGIEANMTVEPVRGLILGGSVTRLDAKYRDYPGAPCLAIQTGCTQATNNIGGYPLPFASKWSGQGRIDFTQPVGGRYKLNIGSSVDFRSKTFISATLDPLYGVQDANAKINARIQFGDIDDRWSVALVGRNINNRKVASQSYVWPLEPPAVIGAFLEETRSVVAQVSVKF